MAAKTVRVVWLLGLTVALVGARNQHTLGASGTTDHELADLATQQATSATKLPPSDDLATLFPLGPDPAAVPLCAHWSDVFLEPEKHWHGRIAGLHEERVFIHRKEPQLCLRSADDGCTPTAYVLPGDRVDVGFICGHWSYVQYHSHARSRANTRGWIETARLYGIDVKSPTGSPGLYTYPKPAAQTDPLAQAAAENDLGRLKDLITSGESPDGIDKSGAPLTAAVLTGNNDAVNLLLDRGANVNPHNADGTCRDLFTWSVTKFTLPTLEDAGLFARLVRAGANLSCRSGSWLTTPLMNVSGYNRLNDWHMIQDHIHPGQDLMDPVAVVTRLLKAGADPNVRDLAGRTALFYTAEVNNIDVAAILLNAGADPNISVDAVRGAEALSMGDQIGSTPLMTAYNWFPLTFDPTLIRVLLDHGADPNYRNKSDYDSECDETTQGKCTFQGQTVLTRAAEDGDYTVVRILLEHGADPRIARADNALPADIARKNGHTKVASLIESYLKH